MKYYNLARLIYADLNVSNVASQTFLSVLPISRGEPVFFFRMYLSPEFVKPKLDGCGAKREAGIGYNTAQIVMKPECYSKTLQKKTFIVSLMLVFWTFQSPNSRWWFQIFFIFTPIWGRFPIWLIFFKGVETTNRNFVFGTSFLVVLGNSKCRLGIWRALFWISTWHKSKIKCVTRLCCHVVASVLGNNNRELIEIFLCHSLKILD